MVDVFAVHVGADGGGVAALKDLSHRCHIDWQRTKERKEKSETKQKRSAFERQLFSLHSTNAEATRAAATESAGNCDSVASAPAAFDHLLALDRAP